MCRIPFNAPPELCVVWPLLVLSIHACLCTCRPATEDETTESFADELRHHVALAAAAAAASSPCRLAVKEGREAFVDPCEKEQGLPSLPHHQQQQQQGEKEQEDDMTVMKRKAQVGSDVHGCNWTVRACAVRGVSSDQGSRCVVRHAMGGWLGWTCRLVAAV